MNRNVINDIFAWEKVSPGKTAVIFNDELISYADFCTSIKRWASVFVHNGISEGAIVLIFLPQNPDALFAFFGAIYAGMVPSFMPLPSAKQDSNAYWNSHAELIDLINPEAIIAFESDLKNIQSILLKGESFKLIPVNEATKNIYDKCTVGVNNTTDTCLLQHSSGTTGLKKGVILSHEAIRLQVEHYAKSINASSDDVVVTWLPVYHDMGLIACTVSPLLQGQTIVLMDPFEWVKDPVLLFNKIDQYKGTLCWMPNFAFELLTKYQVDDVNLGSMRAFINCSEVCKAKTFDKFHKSFAKLGVKIEMLQVCYAMAESVFAISQTDIANPVPVNVFNRDRLIIDGRAELTLNGESGVQLLSAGKVLSGVSLKIFNSKDEELPAGCVGEIRFQGEFIFNGYYNRAELSGERFKNNWYKTNDSGFIFDGMLYVLGRLDDLIIVHGKNYFSHEIEAIVNNINGLKSGRNVAIDVYNAELCTNEVVVIAERDDDVGGLDSDKDILMIKRAVKKNVNQLMSLDVRDVFVVPSGWLVKTTSGKISRAKNKVKFLNSIGDAYVE